MLTNETAVLVMAWHSLDLVNINYIVLLWNSQMWLWIASTTRSKAEQLSNKTLSNSQLAKKSQTI